MKTNNYLLISVVCGMLSLNSCSEYDDAEAPDARQNDLGLAKDVVVNPDDEMLNSVNTSAHKEGFVYVTGNDPVTNYIYVYRQPSGGELTYATKVASGGPGTGQMLSAQGSVGIDRANRLMYVLNSGDNSVSSFEIMPDGIPKLISTVRTEGVTPVSIAVGEGKFFVVHSGSSTITGFRTDGTGNMAYIQDSTRKLSTPGAGPAQIALSPSGNYVFVTESMNDKISYWRLAANGRPGSRQTISASGRTPAGIDFGHNKFMIIANGETGGGGLSTAGSYSGVGNGQVSDVNGAVQSFQTGAMAIKSTANGYYSFVTNNGSDNISSYYTGYDGAMALAEKSIQTGDGPSGIALASNNVSVYVICENDDTIHSYLRSKGGTLVHTAKTLNHARSASGIAAW